MAQNGNVSEFRSRSTGRSVGKPTGLHPLHEAAMKLAGMGLNRSHAKTRDLVAMLLGHGARAWRASQPEAKLHLHVTTPAGNHPIRLRLR